MFDVVDVVDVVVVDVVVVVVVATLRDSSFSKILYRPYIRCHTHAALFRAAFIAGMSLTYILNTSLPFFFAFVCQSPFVYDFFRLQKYGITEIADLAIVNCKHLIHGHVSRTMQY